MTTKMKILIRILAIGIVLIGGWWVWDAQTKEVDCSEITSMLDIEKCIGKKIEAIGILECEKPGVPSKAGIHYLRFEDGTELKFLEGYQNCKSYDGKKVKVIGELYRCGERDQCAGIGLINIESVNFVEEVITITTDKTEYKQEEAVKIAVKNNLDKSIWYNARTCSPFCYALQKLENGEWRNSSIAIDVVFDLPVSPSSLEPNGELTRNWDMSIMEDGSRKIAETGVYRFFFDYGLSRDSYTDKTIYSKEFTIKEKKETAVILATDKTEYKQGETITITVRNGSDKPIWYIKEACPPSCCNLFRWETNEWENLGDPMPCIQAVPPPTGEPYFIKPHELKLGESIKKQWDMTIGRKSAEGGRYRFSFYYGLSKDSYTEKTIYSNEFTIKENKKAAVIITADKTGYEQGEIIKIIVRNGLNLPIFYSGGERFWFIEKFEDEKWVRQEKLVISNWWKSNMGKD